MTSSISFDDIYKTVLTGCSPRRLIGLLAVVICLAFGPVMMADAITLDRFGIGEAPMNRDSDYLAECDEIIATGIKWIRVGPSWNRIEKSKGVYDTAYLAKCDEVINRLTSNGVNVLWILSYTAPWASSNPSSRPTFHKPANWADWEDFVQFVCTRYKGKIKHWEVWNEPDHPSKTFWEDSPADFAVLLQKASAKVRSVDPENKVVISGFTGGAAAPREDLGGISYLDSLFDADPALGSYFDIMAWHAYVDSANMINRYNEFATVMAARNIAGKPTWITETGYSSNGYPEREVTKAEWLDQTRVTLFRLPGIERLFWYNYRNSSSGETIELANYGLEDSNRVPLKAYYHYQGGDCAETNFALQKAYPTEAAQRLALTFVNATSGDAVVGDYAPDGSSKLIHAGHYLVCRINDHYILGNNHGLDSSVTLEVTYWDEGAGEWQLQYQTATNTAKALTHARTNTLQWKTQSFTMTDHDFQNGQGSGGDFRIYAGSSKALAVSRVAVRREMNPGRVILGSANYNKLLEQALDTNPTGGAYTIPWTIGGRECRKVEDGGKYFYFKVSDGLVGANDADVTIGIRYYDTGTDNIIVQYQSTTSGGATVNAPPIVKTNTNTWKYGTVRLIDAKFDNSRSYKADFRIGSGPDGSAEYIDMVDVRRNEALPPPTLSISPAGSDIAAAGGITTFTVTNTGGSLLTYGATMTVGGEWAVITEGTGGSLASGASATIIIDCAPNQAGGAARMATLTVTAAGATGSPQTVTLTQAANPATPTLEVNKIILTLAPAAGSTGTFGITGNVAWNATVIDTADTWLTIAPAAGAAGVAATGTARALTANTAAAPRTGVVDIIGGGITRSLIVTQLATNTITTAPAALPGGAGLTLVFGPSESRAYTVVAGGKLRTTDGQGLIDIPYEYAPSGNTATLIFLDSVWTLDFTKHTFQLHTSDAAGPIERSGDFTYTVTVTFAANAAGVTVSPASKTVVHGGPYGVLPEPARDGYTLAGWFANAAGTGPQVTASTTVTTGTHHTLHAKWTTGGTGGGGAGNNNGGGGGALSAWALVAAATLVIVRHATRTAKLSG